MNVSLIRAFIRNAQVVFDAISSEEIKDGQYDDLVLSLSSAREVRAANSTAGFRFMKRSGTTIRFGSSADLDDPRSRQFVIDISVNGLDGRSSVSHAFYQAVAWMILASRVSLGFDEMKAYSYWKNSLETLPSVDLESYFDGVDPEFLFKISNGPCCFVPTWTAVRFRNGFEFLSINRLPRPVRYTQNGTFLIGCAEQVDALACELEDCVLRKHLQVVPGSHGPIVDASHDMTPQSSFIITR